MGCNSRTLLVQRPYNDRTALRPRVRALCAAFPARSHLLPALTRSLRAASVFLTSPPQQDKRARSGTLRLYYTSKQTTGETNPETHWGTRNRPRPQEKHGPGSRFPRPLLPPPSTTHPAAPMTGEIAQHDSCRRIHDRGKCTAPAANTAPRLPGEENLQMPGEPGNPPKARGSPVPPDPLPPSPRPRARCARHRRLPYRAGPGHHGNQPTARRHPGTAPTPARAETARTRRRGNSPDVRVPPYRYRQARSGQTLMSA